MAISNEDRDAVIEEIAKEIDVMRVVGQNQRWWQAWWTYFDEPYPGREKIAAFVRRLKRL